MKGGIAAKAFRFMISSIQANPVKDAALAYSDVAF